MQNVLVNINGQILEKSEAKVSVFDRSFLYGDSLYEVLRTYDGKAFEMEAHLDRLEQSAVLARMTLQQSREEYAREMQRTIDGFRKIPGEENSEVYCRIIVSRGVGRIGFGLNCLETKTQYVIIAQRMVMITPDVWEKGIALQVSARFRNDRRALDPAMKSGNYLNNLLAFLEAADAGFEDALLCNSEGFITEGTTFNVFYIRNGILATSPLPSGILSGITRLRIMDAATDAGIPVREVYFPKERLYEADEVFISSTLKDVFPVCKVDSKKINGGKPGTLTKKLLHAYREKYAL